jgi:2-methylcitrate dehydratase
MPPVAAEQFVTLPADSNQARGIADYAIAFMRGELGDGPSGAVLDRTELFHVDSVFCGLSALALGTNAPTVLRTEALAYPPAEGEAGACVFGSSRRVKAEKAIVANSAAVREWDSNGTNFGYNPALGHTAGEFGHNDFYPVAVAACQELGLDGKAALRAMVCHDEIRGRLAEVFSLKTYKIDHVVHGAIASAAVYGALHAIRDRATPEQIEGAIGMTVAHAIPWRAIRAGKQLSDSKGASAAISTEFAVLSMKRAMAGFVGPADIFRNPEAIFRFFEPTTEGAQRWTELAPSPFDLVLAHTGDDFAVMGMHFKLGLYEHQSAGALQGLIDLLNKAPGLLGDAGGGKVQKIEITAYEPAFGIIGNPAKMDPRTRQSADHSMAYIVATALRKALEAGKVDPAGGAHDGTWKQLMLSPYDYAVDERAVFNPLARALMEKIEFRHGGKEYDDRYPDGIPTSIAITDADGNAHDSGMVMYPAGHARNETADLRDILDHKFRLLGGLAVRDVDEALAMVGGLAEKSAGEVEGMYDFDIVERNDFVG